MASLFFSQWPSLARSRAEFATDLAAFLTGSGAMAIAPDAVAPTAFLMAEGAREATSATLAAPMDAALLALATAAWTPGDAATSRAMPTALSPRSSPPMAPATPPAMPPITAPGGPAMAPMAAPLAAPATPPASPPTARPVLVARSESFCSFVFVGSSSDVSASATPAAPISVPKIGMRFSRPLAPALSAPAAPLAPPPPSLPGRPGMPPSFPAPGSSPDSFDIMPPTATLLPIGLRSISRSTRSWSRSDFVWSPRISMSVRSILPGTAAADADADEPWLDPSCACAGAAAAAEGVGMPRPEDPAGTSNMPRPVGATAICCVLRLSLALLTALRLTASRRWRSISESA